MAHPISPDPLSQPDPDDIFCADLSGRLVPFPAAELQSAVAVYGLLLDRQQVLLLEDPVSELLLPPGGLLLGSTFQQPDHALRRLFGEATGLVPSVRQLLLLDEAYQLRQGQGYRVSLFYFLVERPTGQRSSFIDFDQPGRPRWVRIDQLARSQLLLGFEAMRLAATYSP